MGTYYNTVVLFIQNGRRTRVTQQHLTVINEELYRQCDTTSSARPQRYVDSWTTGPIFELFSLLLRLHVGVQRKNTKKLTPYRCVRNSKFFRMTCSALQSLDPGRKKA